MHRSASHFRGLWCPRAGRERPARLGAPTHGRGGARHCAGGALWLQMRNPRRPTRAHPCPTRERLTSSRQLPPGEKGWQDLPSKKGDGDGISSKR